MRLAGKTEECNLIGLRMVMAEECVLSVTVEIPLKDGILINSVTINLYKQTVKLTVEIGCCFVCCGLWRRLG